MMSHYLSLKLEVVECQISNVRCQKYIASNTLLLTFLLLCMPSLYLPSFSISISSLPVLSPSLSSSISDDLSSLNHYSFYFDKCSLFLLMQLSLAISISPYFVPSGMAGSIRRRRRDWWRHHCKCLEGWGLENWYRSCY